MQMYDAIQFRISNDLIECQTPQSGVTIEDFLHTMRRALDAYRSNKKKTLTPPPSCAYPPVEAAGECVK